MAAKLSPKTSDLPFEVALAVLKEGQIIQRKGWGVHGADAFLFVVVRDRGIYLHRYSGSVVRWEPQEYDLLANDWQIALSKDMA